MRVVVLGGAGGMGRVAVRTVAGFGFVEELVVADLDEAAAERLAERTAAEQPGTRLSAAPIDVTDPAALARLLGGAQAVLNTTGPFFRLGRGVLEAAIEAGCHHLDICDDWEPTLEMLALDERARAAGVTAVLGMGASPGLSNLLAARAMRELDHVRDLYTAWPIGGGGGGGGEGGRPSAAVVHWVKQLTGTIRLLRNGRFVDVPALETVKLDYPGLGEGTAYTVGHPEPVTLGRHGRVTEESANLMVIGPSLVGGLRQIRDAVDAGELGIEEAAALIVSPGRGDGAIPDTSTLAGPGSLPPFFALARGTRGGAPASVGAMLLGMPAGMGKATGIPLALALAELAEGRIEQRGVFAPEDVIEPDRLFDRLAPYCDPPVADGAALVRVSVAT